MNTTCKIGNETVLVTDGELKYIEFECLNKYKDVLTHRMSTRAGGVSSGECSYLNLGFNRNDKRENVLENFNLICGSAGPSIDSLVLTNQVHDAKVRVIDEKDAGKGILRESDIVGIDGFVTITPGVTMVTFHADCVPVFLFEPGIKAAALLHSGWRSTLKNIASSALKEMKSLKDFNAERLIAVLGPSIGSCCFEVDEDVYLLFKAKFENTHFYEKAAGSKWKINLKAIIEYELLSEGLLKKNIHDSGICTKCRKDLFFSHRGDNGKTGSLAAFMQIKR